MFHFLEAKTREETTIISFTVQGVHEEGHLQPFEAELLRKLPTTQGARVVLNFSGLLYFSSAAIKFLIDAKRQIERVGGRFQMCCIRANIMEMLKAAGQADYLCIQPDLETALAQE